MQRHGWTLLFHGCVIDQLQRLQRAANRAMPSAPQEGEGNANVRLFRSLSHLMLEVIPSDPSREEYRQGNTLGPEHRHWRRAKIGRRFRLFFRYDSGAKAIIYAWVNEEDTLRSAGSRSDPYAVFRKMLVRGNPPDDWATLKAECSADWASKP